MRVFDGLKLQFVEYCRVAIISLDAAVVIHNNRRPQALHLIQTLESIIMNLGYLNLRTVLMIRISKRNTGSLSLERNSEALVLTMVGLEIQTTLTALAVHILELLDRAGELIPLVTSTIIFWCL